MAAIGASLLVLPAPAQAQQRPDAPVDLRLRPTRYPFRDPGVAFALSLVLPGGSQMYNGDVQPLDFWRSGPRSMLHPDYIPAARSQGRRIARGRVLRHSRGMKRARKLAYTVILEEDPPGQWHGYAPAVPGCFAGGRTRGEALRRFRSALTLHLQELGASGKRPPRERRSPAVHLVIAA